MPLNSHATSTLRAELCTLHVRAVLFDELRDIIKAEEPQGEFIEQRVTLGAYSVVAAAERAHVPQVN